METKPTFAANYIEMRRKSNERIHIWRAWVDKDAVVTQWGLLGGKLQEVTDRPGPKGRQGTKAFISAEQSARNTIIREMRDKYCAGYETISLDVDPEMMDSIDLELRAYQPADFIQFDGPLPNNLCFNKPVNTVSVDKLRKLEQSHPRRLAYTTKINGMMHIVSKDAQGRLWMQSRGRMHVVNDKYPHLVETFTDLLPPRSIVLAELYVGQGMRRQDFLEMQSIENSLPERALKMQEKYGRVRAYVVRTPFWDNVFYEDRPIGQWIERPADPLFSTRWTDPLDIIAFDYDFAHKELIDAGYEGLVVYDMDGVFGTKAYNFKGIPDRPAVCWKVKVDYEDDFIARFDPWGPPTHCNSKCGYVCSEAAPDTDRCPDCGKKLQPDGSFGSGKNSHRVGALSLYQYARGGEVLWYICDVSSGLSDAQRESIAASGCRSEYVMRIKYKERSYLHLGDASNALFHPAVDEIRTDKAPEECIDELL